MSLPLVRSVFLSAGNIKVIWVATQFKNKKCFLGRVVHMTSRKHTCSQTQGGETLDSQRHGSLSLENIQRWSHLITQSGKFHSEEGNKEHCDYFSLISGGSKAYMVPSCLPLSPVTFDLAVHVNLTWQRSGGSRDITLVQVLWKQVHRERQTFKNTSAEGEAAVWVLPFLLLFPVISHSPSWCWGSGISQHPMPWVALGLGTSLAPLVISK